MNQSELQTLLSEHKNVLLEFHAAWCEPCKWAEPVVKDVLAHFKDALHLHKLDIDAFPLLSRDYKILSVPTFVLVQNSVEVWRMRGFDISPVMIRSIEKFMS